MAGRTLALLNAEGICLNPGLAGDAGKIQSSFGSIRGVHDVEFDPNYAYHMVSTRPRFRLLMRRAEAFGAPMIMAVAGLKSRTRSTRR